MISSLPKLIHSDSLSQPFQEQKNSSGIHPDNIQHTLPCMHRHVAHMATLAHVTCQMSDFGCVRLEIEAQERALEQLEKSTQEATRKAHDAEQRARSAQESLKASLSFLFVRVFVCILVCNRTCMVS